VDKMAKNKSRKENSAVEIWRIRGLCYVTYEGLKGWWVTNCLNERETKKVCLVLWQREAQLQMEIILISKFKW